MAGCINDGLERYTVYDKKADNSLDTSLYAYGRDALGKKNFGATGRINAVGDTAWSVNRRYTWDGDWVVADSTEVGRRYYAYLGHRRIAEVAEDTAGKWTSRAVLTDHLGTVTGVVGDSGKVEATYQMDPYGNLEKYAGTYQTLYLYTGKEWVSELAGYEFGARIYDPVMGMWWGRDKAGQFWSPFVRAGNPLVMIDADGQADQIALMVDLFMWKLGIQNNQIIESGPFDFNFYAEVSLGLAVGIKVGFLDVGFNFAKETRPYIPLERGSSFSQGAGVSVPFLKEYGVGLVAERSAPSQSELFDAPWNVTIAGLKNHTNSTTSASVSTSGDPTRIGLGVQIVVGAEAGFEITKKQGK